MTTNIDSISEQYKKEFIMENNGKENLSIHQNKPTKYYVLSGTMKEIVTAKTPYLALILAFKNNVRRAIINKKETNDPFEFSARISTVGFVSPALLRKEIDEIDDEELKNAYKNAWIESHKNDIKLDIKDAVIVAVDELKAEGILPDNFYIPGITEPPPPSIGYDDGDNLGI